MKSRLFLFYNDIALYFILIDRSEVKSRLFLFYNDIALYFILIDRSEVKLRLFFNPLCGEKIMSEIKIHFQEKYSVFLRKSVLWNYVIM